MLILIISISLILLDQLTKILVRNLLPIGEPKTFIPGFIRLNHIENSGASFGIFENHRILLMTFSIISMLVLIYAAYRLRKRHRLLSISLAMILGGGLGNMIDRLFHTGEAGIKAVTDFFEFTFMNFAVFNLADIAISAGAVLLAVYALFIEPKLEKNAASDNDGSRDAPDGTFPQNDCVQNTENEENP